MSDYLTCLRCGRLMPDGASFCNSCGSNLKAPPLYGFQGAVSPEDFEGAMRNNPATAHFRPPQTAGTAYHPAVYAHQNTDGTAVFSLACGVLSFTVLPVLAALAAVASGYISRERIRESGGRLQGGGMALTGIVLGVLNLALSSLLLVTFLLMRIS